MNLLDEFLNDIGLSGLLLHTKEILSRRETYYVLRLRNTSLIQRYIVVHKDHNKSKLCCLSIDKYYTSLEDARDYVDNAEYMIKKENINEVLQ